MSNQHADHDRVDVTAMSDDHRQILCLTCGKIYQGEPMPLIDPVEAQREEDENMRKIRTWAALNQ